MTTLAKAKRDLYGLLLGLDKPTDSEINIMYKLSMDRDVQRILRKSLNNEK